MSDEASVRDPYIALARRSIEYYLHHHHVMATPEDLPAELIDREAGAFVTLHKDGRLRGCIGTIVATRPNLAEEIIHNAIAASMEDPRFPRVQADELDALDISVDVLGAAEPVDGLEDLDPVRYGVIVSRGFRRGLLLPNLEGVDTPEEQVMIALRKAGIHPSERYALERFEVVRHEV
ncbi:MAG: AmmeMemoRadiSam system protein A [Saccharofermentanales bacterium]|jgi:AmmeMemoRadiSam system protein A